MTKLNQIVAIEKGSKTALNGVIDAYYKQVQKPAPFTGITRTYQARDDEGETLPAERTGVMLRAEELLATTVRDAWVRLLDLTATKDVANAAAKADIKIGDTVIAAAVPVTFLIWLEKQLLDVRTVISKLPLLDTAMTWTIDADGNWATPVVQTNRTKKVPRNHVKAEATDKHPAQVEMWFEDIPVGTWNTVHLSGAVPAARQRELLARVAELLEAVKIAREEANMADVTDQHVGGAIFDYLLG